MKYAIAIILLTTVFGIAARAQVFSGAFDPDCYQPIIGTHGVVDTIYGWETHQALGAGVFNLGAVTGESYGRIICNGFNGISTSEAYTMFLSGPDLNIHKLSVVDTFHMGYTPGGIDPQWIRKIGHFRSKRYNDILYGDPQSSLLTIYWQDDEGRYHDSDFTNLRSGLSSLHGQDIDAGYLFAGPLGDDSLIDILTYVRGDNWLTFQDSVYLLFYKGGQHLHDQGRTAIADSSLFLDSLGGKSGLSSLSQGDFRGVGREDIIASKDIGCGLYYKNDPPFSMASLNYQLTHDTLYSAWENKRSTSVFGPNQFSTHVFPKAPGDSSVDFMPFITYPYGPSDNQTEFRVFKGGKDFGSHRIYIDSADFILHNPQYYDPVGFAYMDFGNGLVNFPFIFNCGDMTGTGNPVICVVGDVEGDFIESYFFYVLGKALDDKVDMYLGLTNTPIFTGMDTLVADHDNLQDVVMGMPGYKSDQDNSAGKDFVGTLWIVHGSKKIPVRVNGVTSTMVQSPNPIALTSNPVTTADMYFQSTLSNAEEVKFRLRTITGELVFEQMLLLPSGIQDRELHIGHIPNGVYVLEADGGDFSQRLKVLSVK